MQELPPKYNAKIITPFPLINAVLSNAQDGSVFVEKEIKELFYIIHKSGFSYLVKNDSVDYSEIFNFLLYSHKIPKYFHIYDPPLQLIDLCNRRTEEVNIKMRKRQQLKFKDQKPGPSKDNLPGNFTVNKISAENFMKLSVFNLGLEDKFWRSKDDFIKNGFGFCVFNEVDLPVSICYTACNTNSTAEIDVATLPSYQRKGLAYASVFAFVEYCIENGIIANWDCFDDNYGSLKTAERIGFKHINTYNFLSIYNKKKINETQ